MVNLVFGFIIGVIACLLWQRLFGLKEPAFKELMQKEMAANGQLGSLAVLKTKVETLEAKIARLEQDPAAVIADGALEAEGEKADAKLLQEANPQERALKTVGFNNPDSEKRLTRTDRKAARTEVISLWRSGKSADQIASGTGLGIGEVKLIIALKGSRETG